MLIVIGAARPGSHRRNENVIAFAHSEIDTVFSPPISWRMAVAILRVSLSTMLI